MSTQVKSKLKVTTVALDFFNDMLQLSSEGIVTEEVSEIKPEDNPSGIINQYLRRFYDSRAFNVLLAGIDGSIAKNKPFRVFSAMSHDVDDGYDFSPAPMIKGEFIDNVDKHACLSKVYITKVYIGQPIAMDELFKKIMDDVRGYSELTPNEKRVVDKYKEVFPEMDLEKAQFWKCYAFPKALAMTYTVNDLHVALETYVESILH